MKILSRIYLSVVTVADGYVPQRYNRQWNHPADSSLGHNRCAQDGDDTTEIDRIPWSHIGPKTIFFWAPLFKWVLVIAGLGDITRPAEKLSLVQSTALLSGYIWARYSLIIIPRNVNLCLVNLFVGLVGSVQLTRIYLYRKSLETPDPKKQE